MKEKIRIGSGAGFSGDRIEPAVVLAASGQLDYLVLECLAERTIGLAQKRKLADPALGYDLLLTRRIETLLPHLVKNKITLITNMGAANPLAAAKKVQEISQSLGYSIRIAAVDGDDVLTEVEGQKDDLTVMETGKKLSEYSILSANAYLGVEGILEALEEKAQIIITGRVADPSLFLAPMVFEFGWHSSDFHLLGCGTVIGHLLECAGQLTGGYFADTDKKSMPDLAHLGHPFADVFANGDAVLGKVENTGGSITLATVKEQLLYEVINPNAYFTPDVSANFIQVKLTVLGPDRIQISGGTGKEKPSNYKVSVGYRAGFVGEGEISYAGDKALERARLAGEIIRERIKDFTQEIRVDYIGWDSVHRKNFRPDYEPYEVRLRIAAKTDSMEKASWVGEEVEALYTNGPAGGGGVRKYAQEQLGIVSVLIPRSTCTAKITLFES
jgi:hypothetical protein